MILWQICWLIWFTNVFDNHFWIEFSNSNSFFLSEIDFTQFLFSLRHFHIIFWRRVSAFGLGILEKVKTFGNLEIVKREPENCQMAHEGNPRKSTCEGKCKKGNLENMKKLMMTCCTSTFVIQSMHKKLKLVKGAIVVSKDKINVFIEILAIWKSPWINKKFFLLII